MFTLRILVGGETQIEQPNLTFERLRALLPIIESAVPDLRLSGPVAVLVKTDERIVHILGAWN
jgi:hypothetical protein